jgi:hypothetical protein
MTHDYRVSDDPAWQPFTDSTTGEVVTLTPSHCNAIFRALDVWLKVAPEGPQNEFLRAAVLEAQHGLRIINMKSCLMARLLYDGKAPLVDAPPTVAAAPDYRVEVPRD